LWHWLIQAVLEKKSLNACSSSSTDDNLTVAHNNKFNQQNRKYDRSISVSIQQSLISTAKIFPAVSAHALVAVSKGMRAEKLCTNKILQFITGGAS